MMTRMMGVACLLLMVSGCANRAVANDCHYDALTVGEAWGAYQQRVAVELETYAENAPSPTARPRARVLGELVDHSVRHARENWVQVPQTLSVRAASNCASLIPTEQTFSLLVASSEDLEIVAKQFGPGSPVQQLYQAALDAQRKAEGSCAKL